MKKRKRLLVILSTFVMLLSPCALPQKCKDAEGFGAGRKKYGLTRRTREEFSAAPEGWGMRI